MLRDASKVSTATHLLYSGRASATMFTTLQPDRERRLNPRPGIETPLRRACVYCRTRKLRCSMEPEGCERCRREGKLCGYIPRGWNLQDRTGTTPSDPRLAEENMQALLNATFDPLPLETSQAPVSSGQAAPTAAQRPPVDVDQAVCYCVDISLAMIDRLERGTQDVDMASITKSLSVTRRVFLESHRLRDCQACKDDQTAAMLCIIVFQNLNFAHERILNVLGTEYNRVHERDDFPLAETSQSAPAFAVDQRPPAVIVEEYAVDEAERPCVFGGITVTQLWSLKSLVRARRVAVQERQWSRHVVLLDAVEAYIDDQLRRCQKS